jgi:endonuclease/exonuclease/phosphatase family metal-dependent hydrolase
MCDARSSSATDRGSCRCSQEARSRHFAASRDARLRCLRSIRGGNSAECVYGRYLFRLQRSETTRGNPKIPAQAAWSESWKSMEGIDPPRGFAFAWFKIGNADIGVYSLHLKSNRITHGNTEAETARNIRKREVSIQQLLAHVHDVIGTVIPSVRGLIIGGDFNTNHDQEMFAAERTLDTLTRAAYRSAFEGISFQQRITHPGSHGFPDATFDYLFGRNVRIGKPIITQTNVSDHLPVTCDVEF